MTCVECLCLSSLLKEERGDNVGPKLNKKKKKMDGRHHVTMLMVMVRKDVRNFAWAVKQS